MLQNQVEQKMERDVGRDMTVIGLLQVAFVETLFRHRLVELQKQKKYFLILDQYTYAGVQNNILCLDTGLLSYRKRKNVF